MKGLILGLCISILTSFLWAFEKEDTARVQHTLSMLRCVVCQNQNLLDSQAPLAQLLKRKVRHMIKAGYTDSEIFDHLAKHYGDFILFKPPFKPLTWILWIGPFLILWIVLMHVFFFIKRQTRV